VSLLPPLDSSLVPLVASFAIGGVLVAVVLLAIEYRAPRLAALLTSAAGGLLLVLAGALLLLGGAGDFAMSLAALAAVVLLTVLVRLETTRRIVGFLVAPALVWGLLLVVSVAAVIYIPYADRPSDDGFQADAVIDYHFVEGFLAVTDQGRELRLCAYDESASLLESERGILGVAKYQHQLIRLAEPSTACNCHGWVYTGGKFAIRSRDIDGLLEDNGYAVVSQPRAGDLVIYRTPAREIAHTGVVRLVTEDGSALVESKWGPLGVYLHPVAAQPYGDLHAFYRSQRAGHLIAVLPGSSLPAEEPALVGDLPSPLSDPDTLVTATRRRPVRQLQDRPLLRVPGQRKT
jgi:hypothetical protein